MIDSYLQQIKDGLDQIFTIEMEKMKEASRIIAQTIINNGIIHIFGCGHSHMMAEEMFYRAGGLVPINPILIEPLMLHEGAVQSSYLERRHDYATSIINEQNIKETDVVIIVSTSGRNPVPIDAAITAKEKGSFVIGLTSFNYATMKSRHNNGKHLAQCVDLAINNHVKKGDAVLTHANVKVPFTPVSTINNTAILNAISAKTVEYLVDEGFEPPLFKSGNLDNADEYNNRLIKKYEDRVPLLHNTFHLRKI